MFEDTDDEYLAWSREKKGQTANQRRTVRYIRNDISASIRKESWLSAVGFNRFRKKIPVELLDISNRGCLVSSSEKLTIGAQVTAVLEFEAGKCFEIKAAVVRKAEGRDHEYGIKFAKYNNELGEYMLEMQSELIFK
jgi:hypothetical protein